MANETLDKFTFPTIPTLNPDQVKALIEMAQAFGFVNPYVMMLNPVQQKAIVDLATAFGLSWLTPLINAVNNLPTPTPAPAPAPAKA